MDNLVEVTDPTLLDQLNSSEGSNETKEVTDPALLSQLNGEAEPTPEAIPTKPAPKNKFRYNANEPATKPVERKPVSISKREPEDADTSTAMGDIEAGIETLKQVRPALAVAGAAGDIARANRMQKGAALDEQELAQIDKRLADIEKLPDDQWQKAGDERAKLSARRSQLMMLYPQGQGPQSAEDEAAVLKPKAVQSIVKNIGEIQKLSKAIEAIPTNPAAKQFNDPEGEGLVEKAGSMWDALASDPYGVTRTLVLRSLPSSAPTMLASIVGGIAGPEGAAAMGALAGGSIEMGTSMAQYLTEDLQAKGIDTSDQAAVEKYALENTDEILTMIGKARVRAVVIGGASGAVGGFTENLAEGVVAAPFKKKAATAIAGAGIESAGDSAGELAAEVAAGDEISLPDIVGEGLGSAVTGGATTAGQIARENLTTGGRQKVETVSDKGANSAEAAALNATQPTVAPPRRETPPTQAPAEVKSGIQVGETPPDQQAAVTAASNQPTAPQPPTPGTGPGAAGEYIKALAAFRQKEREYAEQNAAPESAPAPAAASAGPQVGGVPAAPPSRAAEALQELGPSSAPPSQPVSPEAREPASSPAKQAADALPPVNEMPEPSAGGGDTPTQSLNETITATPKKPKYQTVTQRDVLLDAGIAPEDYDGMPRGKRASINADIRSKVRRETGMELERMDPAEREKAVTAAWQEITKNRQAAEAKAAAEREAARAAREAARAQRAPRPPKAQAAVNASKAKEGPTPEELAAQKEAERKARVEAYMAEQRQKNEEEAAKPVEPGQRRVLRPTNEDALRSDAEAAVAQQEKQAQNEAEIKQAEERQQAEQDATAAALPEEPETVTNKIAKAERARRVNNKRAADEIIAGHNTNKQEDAIQSSSPKGDVARASVMARARAMVEEMHSKTSPNNKGEHLFERIAMSDDPDLAPNAAQMLLFEARRLAKKSNPNNQDFVDFRSAEALLRAGMIDAYLESRGIEGGAKKGPKKTKTNNDGVTTDATEDMASDASTPEENLEAREEGDEDAQAMATEVVTDQVPEAGVERPRATSESNPGYRAVSGDRAKKVQVESKPKGRSGRKLDVAISPEQRAAAAAKLTAEPKGLQGNWWEPLMGGDSEGRPKKRKPNIAEDEQVNETEDNGPEFNVKPTDVTSEVMQDTREEPASISEYETGKPFVADVYHGTNAVFRRFLNQFKNSKFVSGFDTFWFARNKKVADSYTRRQLTQADRSKGRLDWLGGNVRLSRIRMENPLVIDMEGKRYDPNKYAVMLKKAKDEGHDGVVLKNVIDGGNVASTVYGVFDEQQVSDTFKPDRPLDQIFPSKRNGSGNSSPVDRNLRENLSEEEILDKTTLDAALSKASALPGSEFNRGIVATVISRLREKVGDTPVLIVDQEVLDRLHPKEKPGDVAGDYDPRTNTILISALSMENGKISSQLLSHEGLHALLSIGLETDEDLRADVDMLLDAVRAKAIPKGRGNEYGLTNAHEFLSEALTNPRFQDFLQSLKLPREMSAHFGMPSGGSIWQALARMVTAYVLKRRNLLGIKGSEVDALTAVMSLADKVEAQADKVRDEVQTIRENLDNMEAMPSKKGKDANVGELIKRGLDPKTARSAAKIIAENFKDGISDEDLASIVEAFQSEPKKQSAWNQLMAGGVPRAQAKEINDFLKAEVGKSVDPATVPFLIEEAIKAFGKDTSESNPSEGAAPPYKEPPSPGMGPAEPIEPQPASFKGKGEPINAKLRSFALKTMTLDFMRQKFRGLFNDKQGNALEDYVKLVQRRDNIVEEYAEPLRKAAAEFADLARTKPDEAMEFAELAMEATRLNVKLGKGESNEHLGTNAAKGLQGKQRLADLNTRFEKLSPEAKALYKKLTTLYRDAHNSNVEALTYNILKRIEPKLSNSDVMRLMTKVTEGKLDAADEALINDKTLFHNLERATELRLMKGDYFPQMRYGEHVVTTKEKLVDPGWTTVPMKVTRTVNKVDANKKVTKVTTSTVVQIPVKTEIDGNTVRVQVDPTVRGGRTAVQRQLRDYAAKHDLTLSGISKRYKDKATGKLVTEGEQRSDRDYDVVFEARFQTEGAHFFQTRKEAEAFRKASTSDVTSQVMERRNFGESELVKGSTLAAIVNSISANDKSTPGQAEMMKNIVENAVIAQMHGNKAQKRSLARRNVRGASNDIARAALTYATAAGNYHATLRTAPEMHDAMLRMNDVEKGSTLTNNAGAVSQVMNELRAREASIQSPNRPVQMLQDIATLSYFDKLVSPAYSIINGMQPLTTALPVLGGRYGNANASVALASAYHRIGVIETAGAGLKNTAKAAAQAAKATIDTTDLIGSLRKNLGKEYDALIDELIERGVLSSDSGMEVGAATEQGRGAFGRSLAKVDRIARQLPNAIEVMNRAVTAVTAYDLAIDSGKPHQNALQEAVDTVFNTQGDYRGSNTPRWMKMKGLGWALQFKKYGLLQYQLMTDMAHRAFKDADPAERIIARKQLMNLVATQAAVAGTFGLPGVELIKLGFIAAAFLGQGAGWDDEEDKMRRLIEEKTGKTLGSIINNGLLSTVTGIDFASRLSMADLATGFSPKSYDKEGLTLYVGTTVLGAPGSTVGDWLTAAQTLRNANTVGDVQKGLELAIPFKTFGDTMKAIQGYQRGKLSGVEAAEQVAGFRSLKTAEQGRAVGREIRESNTRKKSEKELRNDLTQALDRGDKKAEMRAVAAIREYNIQLKRKDHKARPLNIGSIRRYWRQDKKKENQE